MTWVNDKNCRRQYFGDNDETVNMLDWSTFDENDHINLKRMKEPTIIVGGKGKDKIWGSTKHMNELFGDQAWGFSEGNPTDYDSYSGKDTIYGGDAADFIHGGRGNDKMYGKDGVNIFQFKKGDGKDTIVMGKGTDYLYFCDSAKSELTFVQKNKDLIVKYGENDQVTVKDYYKTFGHVSLKGIADQSFNIDIETIAKGVNSILYDNNGNEKWSSEWQLTRLENKVEDYLERTLKSLPSPKSLYERTGLTIIRTKGGESKGTDATDIITGSKRKDRLYGRGGDDLIKGGKGSDRLYGDNGNDTIYGENGNDIIEGGKGNDTINGGKGNDKIYGVSGTNFITGSKGNDKIYSGSGVDTFYYAKGAGKDTIYNANSSDKIRYKDVASMSDLKFARKRNDIIITRKNGSKKETITLSDFFKTSKKLDKIILSDGTTGSILESAQLSMSGSGTIDGTEYNETIKGSFRADVIYGRGGNDKITGHKGKDTINAGKGTNSIYFGKNDGDDVVLNGGGVDTLVFKKQYVDDLRVRYSGNNAIVYYKGGTVLLKGYKLGGHSAQYIKTKSGTVAIDDLIRVKQTTTDGYTKYYGLEVKDNILVRELETMEVYGNGGGDIIQVSDKAEGVNIYGGKGDDKITLNVGGNTLHFSKGDGKDIVTEKITDMADDRNTFVFENETNVANLKFTKNTNGYTIGHNNNADSVTVIQTGTPYVPDSDDDPFGLGNLDDADIVKLKGGEQFIVSNKGLLKHYFDSEGTGTAASEYFDNTSASTIKAGEGNDYIALSSSTTKVYAGAGNDEIIISDDIVARDLYFNAGDGRDIVYDKAADGRSKELYYRLQSETSIDNVGITRDTNNNIVITYNDGKDSIIIEDKTDSTGTERNYGKIVVENDTTNAKDILELLTERQARSSKAAPQVTQDDIDIKQLDSVKASFMSSDSSGVALQDYNNNKEDASSVIMASVEANNAYKV